MKPSIQTLGQILYSPSQYVIPVFQRHYRWEQPQWEKLWDGVRDFQSPEKRGNHFMGFLVFVSELAQPGENTSFHLIDGQQRLTTASVLLTAIRNVARAKGQAELADEIHSYYLVHPLKKGDGHYRLLPKERDSASYVALISQRGDPIGRLGDALEYYEQQVADVAEEDGDALRSLFNTACQRLEFMCATLEAENAYSIFKSLNSTGVPLRQADLIRNFVFMHVRPSEHDAFDEELWSPLEAKFTRPDGTMDETKFSSFFRDFLMSSGRYVRPQETFETFETRYEGTAFIPAELARSLDEAAHDYSIICGRTPDIAREVTTALAGLNALESSTTYPLLIALFARRRSGAIDSSELADCIQMLRGFILRRYVCGESSRSYGQLFVRGLSEVKETTADTIRHFLLARGWPDDRRFKEAFTLFPLYQRDYSRHVLESIERARGHKEPADLSSSQIEHTMPQTLNEEWVRDLGAEAERIHGEWLHRPGNLTLSGYNLELWNHSFAKKRARYAQSNVVLTREIASAERWSEPEIRSRGEHLATEAAALWVGPAESSDGGGAAGALGPDAPDRNLLRLKFWEGLGDYLSEEHPAVPALRIHPWRRIRVSTALRNIGVELEFSLRHGHAAIEILFKRDAARLLWENIRKEAQTYNSMAGEAWTFRREDGADRAMMSLRVAGDMRNPDRWPEVYRWLGAKLTAIFGVIAPRIRERMEALS